MDKEIFKKIRRIQIRSNKVVDNVLAGSYRSVFKGRGIEFDEVKEYQSGDDPRSIDWNVTARMGFPYIKNFREERELTVMLMVDVSASSNFGSTGKQRNDILAEIGALLAFSAIKNNDKVGIMLFSDVVECYLPPKKGIRHVMKIVYEMLACKPKGKTTNINHALKFFNKIEKQRSICFLISDFISSDFSKSCAIAARNHDLIAICVIDPMEKEMNDMGMISFKDLESGEERIIDTSRLDVRQAVTRWYNNHIKCNRKLINGFGAGFIEVDLSKSYFDDIVKFFKMRSKHQF